MTRLEDKDKNELKPDDTLDKVIIGKPEDHSEMEERARESAHRLAKKVRNELADTQDEFEAEMTVLAVEMFRSESGADGVDQAARIRREGWKKQVEKIYERAAFQMLEGETKYLHAQNYVGERAVTFGRRLSTCIVASTVNCLTACGLKIKNPATTEDGIIKKLLLREGNPVTISEDGYFGAHTPVTICQILNTEPQFGKYRYEAAILRPTVVELLNAIFEGQKVVFSRNQHAKSIIGYNVDAAGQIVFQIVDPLDRSRNGRPGVDDVELTEFINGSNRFGALSGFEVFVAVKVTNKMDEEVASQEHEALLATGA